MCDIIGYLRLKMSSIKASGSGSLSYKSVIMSDLYKLSELTAREEPLDYLLDTIWAELKAFIIEEDTEAWLMHANNGDYQSTMNKARLIVLVLFRNGLIPEKKYIQKRKYAIAIKGKRKGRKGLSSYVIEEIEINQYFMRHMILLGILAKKHMEYGMHVDVLWSILSPYVTEEDYDNWEQNNKTYGNENSITYNPYVWNLEKIGICVTVLDRADFLWQTGMVDEPEEIIDDKGVIRVRSAE